MIIRTYLRTYRWGALLVLVSATLPRASAVPIVYTMTGYVQGSGGGTQVNTSFTWTVTADTAGVTTTSPGHLQNPAVTSNISFSGVGSTGLAGVTVYLNTTSGQITFGNTATGGIGFTNPALQQYALASPVTAGTGTNFLVAGAITTTNGTVIALTGVANPGNGPSPTFTAAFPPPSITSVVNAASNISPGLPNAGIAQGSIFLVFGSGLGPAALTVASAAFQSTSLGGTSVAVTVGGATVNAPMYYTSTAQVAALLPSNTPTGTGSVTVAYSGQIASAPVTVVANNVGIFTLTSNGQGVGIVTYGDYSLVSSAKSANCGGPNTTCGAANPGDTLILWATGLGPVSGSDASGAGLGQNMPNIPLQLWLGGVQVPVIYQGRSGCCIGEDQIVFTVPNNVPTGCAVPLMIQIGSHISNNTVMPVANGSRSCTASNAALASVNVEQAVTAGPITYGSLSLSRDFVTNGSGYVDDAALQFSKILTYPAGSQPFFVTYADNQPPGQCLVYNTLSPANYKPVGDTANADAGSKFTVTGPNGSKVLTASGGKTTATLSAAGTYLSPGSYTITGTGGADIGSFTAAVTIPAAPVLTNPANLIIQPVTRSNGMTITWTGGAPNEIVQIQVSGATDNTFTTGATAVCTAPATAGTITIPAYALLALPAGTNGGFEFTPMTLDTPFTANGLGLGDLTTSGAATFIAFTLK